MNEPCDPPMGIDTCHHASMCSEEGDCVNGCEDRRLRAAWQDVLGDAEQLVRQKPLWAKYIKGTPLENDVPVWMADFALRMLHRERSRRSQDFSAAPSHDHGVLGPDETGGNDGR